MNETFIYQTPAWILTILLFVSMLLMNWIGYKIRKIEIAKNKVLTNDGLGTIQASLLGLLALLLSFTFGMSSSRYDHRREIILEEANNIGIVVLLTDIYPNPIKKNLKNDLKEYLEARIDYFNADVNITKINRAQQNSKKIYTKVWNQVMAESQNPENLLRSQQMIPAMVKMIDVVRSRDLIKNSTVPDSVLWLLFLIIMFASFTVGYTNIGQQKNHVISFVFTATIVLTVFLILNLDRPRRGIINTDNAEKKIVELRSLFQE